MKRNLFLLLVLSYSVLKAQTGVIKGLVIDKQSEIPLSGATIELLNSSEVIGVITDDKGYFRLNGVSVGRQVIRVSYIGFETITIPNIVVSTGKDAVLTVSLNESFDQLGEVILSTRASKDKPINKLAIISARQVSVDEVSRFSGGRSDIGRLATNFAGVSAPNDTRNDIVIRGNSPTGLLWRLEGIPIPSPNHFTTLGTTGGALSAINPNLLKNSDFFTSAFPAEYGNATSGVFDLGFRKGNADDYEFTAQLGLFTGVELLAEGPLGKKKGSFVISGRTSFARIAGAGVGITEATPGYNDLSFNIDFGKGRTGSFSLFGILSNSEIEFLGEDLDEDDPSAFTDSDTFFESNFGVIGLKHQIRIGESSYLRTTFATSFTGSESINNRRVNEGSLEERTILFTDASNQENRSTFSTIFNSKVNSKFTLRTGLLVEGFNVESSIQSREEQLDNDGDDDPDLFNFSDSDDRLTLFQPHIQTRFRITEKFTLNAGLHGLYSDFNDQFVIEPRLAVSYKLTKGQQLSFGYGLHNQPVALPILFFNEEINDILVQTNRALDFVTSNQFVLGYDVKLASNWRGKIEVYYQDISNAAIDAFPSSFSSLTEGANFIFNPNRTSLISEGTGFNRGIEFTLEKFFSKGYYGLLTASFFESRYEGSDGIERNTPFNNGAVINFLTGREFKVGKTGKNALFFDTRLSFSGGRFFTPIDIEASSAAGFEVLLEDEAFSERDDDFFRFDFKFGYTINSKQKKRSHQFFIDLQNITNQVNTFGETFNRRTNEIEALEQSGFLPDFGYRFQF